MSSNTATQMGMESAAVGEKAAIEVKPGGEQGIQQARNESLPTSPGDFQPNMAISAMRSAQAENISDQGAQQMLHNGLSVGELHESKSFAPMGEEVRKGHPLAGESEGKIARAFAGGTGARTEAEAGGATAIAEGRGASAIAEGPGASAVAEGQKAHAVAEGRNAHAIADGPGTRAIAEDHVKHGLKAPLFKSGEASFPDHILHGHKPGEPHVGKQSAPEGSVAHDIGMSLPAGEIIKDH